MSSVRRIVPSPDLLQSLNNAGQSLPDDTWHTNKHISTHGCHIYEYTLYSDRLATGGRYTCKYLKVPLCTCKYLCKYLCNYLE